ncbi:M20 metallopeptidase family protein [Streptomyces somaliensis]|uniref:Amidohydrolase n=1 Tax=Streptomyces somaliensis (strain ATCC 33201 / DSM 40738 / JCM 12659 / KCTC 9044 / NCTC 11332 / NRRL B-12077 / IP 733) TaxID=1134445 RepID=A0AA44DB40_STRE0|nr:M20 family metallopeptidase [Streptomyces somaliensis]NKY13145.1 amidohydrolase [Streptomyces somaliensis DSM 40738]
MTLLEDAHAMAGDLAVLRHALHAEPEIGLDLPRTQEKVLAALEGLPLEVSTGTGTTSVTAVLRGTARAAGGSDGPVVLLRGDMDALPVQEAVALPYTSRVEGAMHACGHDLHTSMLVGAARLLAQHRDRLHGDVVLMFQPGEEGWDGAGVMLREGVLRAAGRPVDAAFALHVFSAQVPQGHFVSRAGTVMSASDDLYVTVRGAGGHGSMPYLAKDPVTAISAMVTALQTMVTREFDVFDPVVVTVGSLHAGTRNNVIPETAAFEATIRTFSPTARERLAESVHRVLRGTAAAHGVEVEVDYRAGYPLTVADAEETARVARTVGEVFGPERYHTLEHPLCGSEDFSRVLDAVPGGFVGLGAVPADLDPARAPSNHSPHARYDDAVLADGAALYAELALRRAADGPRPSLPGTAATQTGETHG